MLIKRLFRISILCSVLFLSPVANAALPALGDSVSGTISSRQEHELGQAFLKLLYSQTKIIEDPEIINYVESLCHRLAEVSELQDYRLSVVVIDDPLLNAFAVPGGILGVNRGLFFYARSEQEFAAVIAHELAHLSQRHYARTLEAAKRQELPGAIALLGSIALAAVSGNAGVAALSATMAGMQSQQLRFSRTHEREADNIGIRTMVAAGMDPRAMPVIFERMGRLEIQQQQLEFLRTHPVTQNRIADASNRAEQYPKIKYADGVDYHFMRERINVLFAINSGDTDNQGQYVITSAQNKQGRQYGKMLIAFENKDWKTATATLNILLKSYPNNLHLRLMKYRMLFEQGQRDDALKKLKNSVQLYPDNLPTVSVTAKLLFRNKNYRESAELLKRYTRKRPYYPFLWRDLADVSGKAGDIVQVHRARAEYFFLTGDFSGALKNLEYAMTLVRNSPGQKIAVKQRIIEIKKYIASLDS